MGVPHIGEKHANMGRFFAGLSLSRAGANCPAAKKPTVAICTKAITTVQAFPSGAPNAKANVNIEKRVSPTAQSPRSDSVVGGHVCDRLAAHLKDGVTEG